MATAYYEEEERNYYLTAWQTALLMNATGNYKRRITPEQLLGFDKKKVSTFQAIDRTEKQRKLEEIKKVFNS